MVEFKIIDEHIRDSVVNFITENWGAPQIISRGKIHNASDLLGVVAIIDEQIKGLITYNIADDECEIVTLDSLVENQGIGSKLIKYVIDTAKQRGCNRLWLITTNDNIKAIKFYQKRNFDMIALHTNAIEESRKIKPQIPLYGCDDIPIKHEIEFEIKL